MFEAKTDPRLRTAEELAEIGARAEASRNWQAGVAGQCNVVNYDGDDITGVAMIPSAKHKDILLGIVADIPALVLHAAALEKQLGDARKAIASAPHTPFCPAGGAPFGPYGKCICWKSRALDALSATPPAQQEKP